MKDVQEILIVVMKAIPFTYKALATLQAIYHATVSGGQ